MDTKIFFKGASGKANNPESEQEFRKNCLLYESHYSAINQTLNQDYQEYLRYYHQITSLYLTSKEKSKTKLIIYDTEYEKGEERILDTLEILSHTTCIAQLPNGDLFCFGSHVGSGITLIIDKNYRVRVLSPGAHCQLSSAIYFNNSLYCFGGLGKLYNALAFSSKFNLNDNRWADLIPMPQSDSECNSVIFNENIMISGQRNANLLLYSIDIDSFSIIPYKFASNKRKILINLERLYLIECGGDGLIYESEDAYNWIQISKSIITHDPFQVYCSYNKGGIYIATDLCRYFKFDLNQKIMTKFQLA